MSDLWIVVTGAVAVLSGVAVITWLARPSEFRSVSVVQPPRYVSMPAPVAAPAPVVTPVVKPIVKPASNMLQGSHWDAGRSSPRTISRGAGDQASVWAKPPSHADEVHDAPTR
jgi:hypothetical protein